MTRSNRRHARKECDTDNRADNNGHHRGRESEPRDEQGAHDENQDADPEVAPQHGQIETCESAIFRWNGNGRWV